jgi:hypothetical protein
MSSDSNRNTVDGLLAELEGAKLRQRGIHSLARSLLSLLTSGTYGVRAGRHPPFCNINQA